MIWFWCDSRANIGLGHVVRCLALAQWAARRDIECRFVVPQMWPGLERFIANFDFEFEVGEAPPTLGVDDVLVIDDYEFPVDDLNTAARTVLIDDIGDRDPTVDVVVNPNVYAPALTYAAAGTTLLGSDYALLRPEFVDMRDVAVTVRPEVERVFVMLGGVDPTNETHKVLSALGRRGFAGRVDLVTARVDLEDTSELFEVVVHRSIASPAPLMQAADLAVCAAGGSTWELACLGVPALQIVVADNQRKIGEWLTRHDAAVVVAGPSHEALLDDALHRAWDLETRTFLRSRARSLVDGHGASRVLDAITG